jgi:hypothetical protein
MALRDPIFNESDVKEASAALINNHNKPKS